MAMLAESQKRLPALLDRSGSAIALRIAFATVSGGIATELGGGKFRNGAVTAAFVHLFNADGVKEKLSKKVILIFEDINNLSDLRDAYLSGQRKILSMNKAQLNSIVPGIGNGLSIGAAREFVLLYYENSVQGLYRTEGLRMGFNLVGNLIVDSLPVKLSPLFEMAWSGRQILSANSRGEYVSIYRFVDLQEGFFR